MGGTLASMFTAGWCSFPLLPIAGTVFFIELVMAATERAKRKK
jgi:hypothetical protein